KCHIRKFRISRKPPELEAARLRENQRRHRARVKARTEELEAALATTQKKLEDALRHIGTLTSELRQLRDFVENPNPSLHPSPPSSTSSSPAPVVLDDATNQTSEQPSFTGQTHGEDCQGCSCGMCTPDKAPVPQFQAARGEVDMMPVRHILQAPITPPDQISTVFSQVGSLEDGCALLPPPGPGESTMLCRDAYSIITQRMSDVDVEMVTESLKAGFRRALAPGGGCRVQTHILFSFVDRIT
ncbi:hypothetical protein B0T16DRAFT_305644, partial [Cercophora newfieldiana]